MKTLVYFASGPVREDYHTLDFDKIYLVDKIFSRDIDRVKCPDDLLSIGKIKKIGMDCLEAIWKLFIPANVKVDYVVTINEGLGEGGGSYSMTSDMFLGFAMPICKDEHVYITGKGELRKTISYKQELIEKGELEYIDPLIFTRGGRASSMKVYKMTKDVIVYSSCIVGNGIKLSVIRDSIWNYYTRLDSVILRMKNQSNDNFSPFFAALPKVELQEPKVNKDISSILDACVEKNLPVIGFTPWACHNYTAFIKTLESYNPPFLLDINLFHLNKNDYMQVKQHFEFVNS